MSNRRLSRRFSLLSMAAISIAAFSATAGFLTTASAQSYPTKPVKIIVPFAAGGPLDLLGRSLAEKLSESLKQPVIIENRGGAGGNVGTDAAAKAAPDGYTLLFVLSGTLAANPAIFDNLPFDPEKSFEPISLVASNSQMLVVHPSVPVNGVAEFVAFAKKQPITYAHAGPGSGGHLSMGYFALLAGFSGTAVPYRGNAPLMTDLSAGQVQSGFISTAGALPHVKSGRLKGLAVSSAERSPLAADIPTMAEAGYPQLKLNTYFVFLAPTKTPPPILELLEREVRKAAASPDLQQNWRAATIDPLGSSAPEAKARLKEETALWVDIVKRARLNLE